MRSGRTHRSNETSGPEYVLIQSEVAGEARFASAVASRMATLGAISKGDHRAGSGQDMSEFDILEGSIPSAALKRCYRVIEKFFDRMKRFDADSAFLQQEDLHDPEARISFVEGARAAALESGLAHYGKFAKATVEFDKDTNEPVKKFLNRLLGFDINIQGKMFALFLHCHANEVNDQKIAGKLRSKNVDIPGVAKIINERSIIDLGPRHGEVIYKCIEVDRGLSWEAAYKKYKEEQEEVSNDMEVAFFQRSQELHGQRQPCLAIVKKKNPQFGDKIRYAR